MGTYRGWGAGQDTGLLQPYSEGCGSEHGTAIARSRALDLRVISPPRFPLECGGGGEVRGVRCAAVALLQSPPSRAASSAHQSSGQISILPSQARYPRPAARCAAVLQRRKGWFSRTPPRRFGARMNRGGPGSERSTGSCRSLCKPTRQARQSKAGHGLGDPRPRLL